MADVRKSLAALRAEWSNCTKCDLGRRRMAVDGEFVFGEGGSRGIMFVGEGPGRDEEAFGRPLIGQAGMILRKVLDRLEFTEHYITNLVACRSCSPATDAGGQPIMRRDYKTRTMLPMMRDEPPLPTQIEACLPRLYEEIYLVDPVLIVALGAPTAKALLNKPIAITDPDVHGNAFPIKVPGAGFVTSRTEKKGVWARKILGKYNLPVEPAEVTYICIPTHHPAYVSKKLRDQSGNSPFAQFAKDIQKAVQVYERYMLEIYGIVPTSAADMVMDFPVPEYDEEGGG